MTIAGGLQKNLYQYDVIYVQSLTLVKITEVNIAQGYIIHIMNTLGKVIHELLRVRLPRINYSNV